MAAITPAAFAANKDPNNYDIGDTYAHPKGSRVVVQAGAIRVWAKQATAVDAASQGVQDADIAALQALTADVANATQAELDAALADIAAGDAALQAALDAHALGDASDAEVALIEAALQAQIDAINAQLPVDLSPYRTSADQDAIDAADNQSLLDEIAATDAEQVVQDDRLDALEAVTPLDEDDFASDSDTQTATQQSVKAYTDRRSPYLAALGWHKSGGQLTPAGSRRINLAAVSFERWVEALNEPQITSYPAQPSASFVVYDRNGRVNTGLGGEDLTAPVDQIQQSWGYDLNGTLTSITAKSGDTNDGANWRVYMDPVTGETQVLLPQFVQTTVTNAFYRFEDCLLYTSPSPRDQRGSRMPSSA